MTPQSLLSLAGQLAQRGERGRPSQATLKRAVSTAYYALFHLLSLEYASLFTREETMRAAICRTVNHRDILNAARDFSQPTPHLPRALHELSVATTPELRAVAVVFARLQELRHQADYNLLLRLSRDEALRAIQSCTQAFTHWETVRKSPAARIFLACFQLRKTWDAER